MQWLQLDEDLDKILEVALAGTVEWKMNPMTAITYNLALEQFGIEEILPLRSKTSCAG